MAHPQPYDNRPRTYTYIPRADGAGYSVPAGTAPAAPAQPAAASVPSYYYPAQYPAQYYWSYPTYNYTQYHYPPTYTYTTAAAPAAPPAQPTTYAYSAGYNYYYPTYATAPAPAAPTTYHYGQTSSEIGYRNRYIATTRGAYEPKKIKPDAKPDDVFWCQEKDGKWYVRSFYNIENDCQPGRWTMDAKAGYCSFKRE